MMKKILMLVALLFCCNISFAQSAKEMLAEIEGKYELDDNGNVTFVKVIDSPELSNDEIFTRAQNYFIYNYGSGKSVIQTQDKEKGLLIGKGVYAQVHVGVSLISTVIDAWHILRIDVKDGKARVIITLTDYDTSTTANGQTSQASVSIATTYPINPKGYSKTVMGKAFYKTYHAALKTLEAVEKAIKEGSTSKAIENADW